MPAVYVVPVPIRELSTNCPIAPGGGVLLFRGWGIASMFDELWSEIADAPGEIFDVIEYKEEWEKDDKFDVEGYIKGNTDYWQQCNSKLLTSSLIVLWMRMVGMNQIKSALRRNLVKNTLAHSGMQMMAMIWSMRLALPQDGASKLLTTVTF